MFMVIPLWRPASDCVKLLLADTARQFNFKAMKYEVGQQLILLTIEGKPAAGKAVIVEVDDENEYYTVRHFINDQAEGELIGRVPEGRLVRLPAIVTSSTT